MARKSDFTGNEQLRKKVKSLAAAINGRADKTLIAQRARACMGLLGSHHRDPKDELCAELARMKDGEKLVRAVNSALARQSSGK